MSFDQRDSCGWPIVHSINGYGLMQVSSNRFFGTWYLLTKYLGSVFRFERGGQWHHDHDHSHTHNEDCALVAKKQCLVLIGVHMDHALVKRVLEQCLCDEELPNLRSEPFGSMDKLVITADVISL